MTEADNLPEFKSNRAKIETATSTETATTSLQADLEGWTAPTLEPGGGDGSDVIEADELARAAQDVDQADGEKVPGRMGKDAFWRQFQMAFKFPSLIDPDFAPLAIQPNEQAMAHEVSDAGFELAEEFLPQILEIDEKWMKLVLVGQFLFAKVMITRAIFAAKSAPQKQVWAEVPDKAQESANQDNAPSAADLAEMDKLHGVKYAA